MIDLRPDFLDTLKRLLAEIVPDCEVRIFGSRYQWTATDASDLDLALIGPGKLHWKTLTRLKAALEESSLPYRVDVLDWRAISPEFQKVIEQGYEVIQKPGLARSSKGWKRYVFSDFVNINPSVRLDSSKDYSFVEMKDLNEKSKFVYPSAKRKPSGGSRFQNNDTLFARITPCLENGKICQVKELENGVGFGSTEFLIFRGKENISDNDFIFYLSRSDEVRRFAEQNMLGTSGRQRVTWVAFNNLELDVPPLPAQRRIAGILSALDDKIEVNRQTNATLEAIAQAIFKEWFVDFNYPGTTGEMQDSELGPIPKGWRVGKLRDVCNVTMGQSPPGESYNETGDGIPFYQGRTDFGFRFPTKRVFTIDPKRFAKQFDTLVSVRAPVGDMNIATENCCIGRGLASVSEKNGNHSFTYYFLRELTEKFKSFEDNGTVFGSINKTDFEKMLCIVPNDGEISAFENKFRSIDGSIFNNEQQSDTLAALRDALLPKLMRGEIEV